jgi:predicted DNA-binding protein with PD1-like motif
VTAIGAFSRATVGFFRIESRNYRKILVAEQSEVLSAIGDIARDEAGRPSLHLHAVLGLEDGSTRGGHHPRKPDWIVPAQATGTRDSAHRPRR